MAGLAHDHTRDVSQLEIGQGHALWEYWTRGKGLARWIKAEHKWTTLRRLLLSEGVPAHQVDGLTTNIIEHVLPGYMKLAHSKSKSRSDPMSERAQMTTSSINDLPDSAFAYIEPGGSKDSSGKTTPRSLRHFPIHDAAHVRNALARAPQSPFGEKAMPKIRAAAKKFGIQVSDDSSGRSAGLATPYTRSFALDDISIRAGGDGRTVDAYMAVFNSPVRIVDRDGEYEEEIDPACFNRAISDAAPSGSRRNWKVGVFYNHGLTIHGTPSERHSEAIGIPLDIRPDGKGVFTSTRYTNDEILEGIRDGRYSSYSFAGVFRRSDPMPTGRYRPSRDGTLTRVRRLESTLREYGPTPFPAYEGAEVIGVRAEQAAALLVGLSYDERQRLIEIFRSGAPLDPPDVDAPDDSGLVAEDSRHREVETRSARSSKQELQNAYARFLIEQGSK
jgi:phage head maturation protease